MDWKKLGKALLFPHIAIMIILVPIATVFLVYSMVFWERILFLPLFLTFFPHIH